MNALIEFLNLWGERAIGFAWPMLWQSSLLIAVVFAFDLVFRRKVRASIRYALWLVVLLKLLLPPSMALPTSLAWWVRPSAPATTPQKLELPTTFLVTYSDAVPATVSIPAEPEFVPPPKASLSAAGWTVLGWGAVSAALLAWMLVRWRMVARNVRRATFVSDWLKELLNSIRSAARVSRSVELRVTTQTMSPAICGLFRPVILLPQSLVNRLTSEQLCAVLLHELVHLRRGDVWVNCLQASLQIFYWWHPFLWLANARIRRVREEAVDDAVMLALSDKAETYGPTLLEVAKLAFNRPLASLGLVGILESRSALRQRIERLMDSHPPQKAGLTIVSSLFVLGFAAMAVPMEKAPATPRQALTEEGAGYHSEPTNLLIRTFRFDANRFYTNLVTLGFLDELPPDRQPGPVRDISGSNFLQKASIAFREYFRSLGVNLDSSQGKTMFWKQSGLMLIRATKQDLDTVGEALAGMAAPKTGGAIWPTNYPSITKLSRKGGEPAGLVEAGRAHLEAGRLDEAEAELNKALTVDPGNRTANYYLSLVQERLAVKGGDDVVAGVASLTNGFLGALTPNLSHDDKPGAPLSLSRKVGLLYQVEVREDGSYRIGAAPVTLLELKARLAESKQANPDMAVHLNAHTNAPLKSIVTLVELLKALQITSIMADTRGGNPTDLYNRNFKVDPNALQTNLRKQGFLGGAPTEKRQGLTRQAANTNSAEEVTEALRKFISKAGVSLNPPRSLSYNDQNGALKIQATIQEFDSIEQALPLLSANPKPQIKIEAGFVEMSTNLDSRVLNFNWPSGNKLLKDRISTNAPGKGPPQIYGILTDPQYRVVLRAWEQRSGVDFLSAPRVTTISGRQAQIQDADTQTVVTGINPQALIPPGITGPQDDSSRLYQTSTMRFGPVLDITPQLSVDGYTISMNVIASVTEFLGYAENSNSVPAYINGQRKQVALPLAQFRSREVAASANVWDGQTIVLFNPSEYVFTTQPSGGTLAQPVAASDRKPLVVFATVRLVDESGNPVHTDEEMPFARDSIPLQTTDPK